MDAGCRVVVSLKLISCQNRSPWPVGRPLKPLERTSLPSRPSSVLASTPPASHRSSFRPPSVLLPSSFRHRPAGHEVFNSEPVRSRLQATNRVPCGIEPASPALAWSASVRYAPCCDPSIFASGSDFDGPARLRSRPSPPSPARSRRTSVRESAPMSRAIPDGWDFDPHLTRVCRTAVQAPEPVPKRAYRRGSRGSRAGSITRSYPAKRSSAPARASQRVCRFFERAAGLRSLKKRTGA